MSESCDVLVLAAHPDDAEIHCGGTILDLIQRGQRVVLIDMSRGEKGTLGDEATRAAEAAAAAHKLGVHTRLNLELPDAEIRDDEATLRAVVAQLRAWRPRVLLTHAIQDVHPDHEATGRVAKRAFFHAGLKNSMPELGAPSRPRFVAHFAGNDLVTPTFCVDISDHVASKRDVVRCYASQVRGDDEHRVRKLDVLDRCEARDRYFGSLSGFSAAEPFVVDGPLPLSGLALSVLTRSEDPASGGGAKPGESVASPSGSLPSDSSPAGPSSFGARSPNIDGASS